MTKLGWVVGAGFKLNAPMIGQGDYLQTQVNYTQGALRYIFQTPNSNWGSSMATARLGPVSDAVYGGTGLWRTATDLQLTTAWNVNAAYEHFWNPRWRTSLYGGYAQVSYGAQGKQWLRKWRRLWYRTVAAARATPGCDNDWQHLVDRFAHPVERHQGLLHGRGRVVLEAAERIDANGLNNHLLMHRGSS